MIAYSFEFPNPFDSPKELGDLPLDCRSISLTGRPQGKLKRLAARRTGGWELMIIICYVSDR